MNTISYIIINNFYLLVNNFYLFSPKNKIGENPVFSKEVQGCLVKTRQYDSMSSGMGFCIATQQVVSSPRPAHFARMDLLPVLRHRIRHPASPKIPVDELATLSEGLIETLINIQYFKRFMRFWKNYQFFWNPGAGKCMPPMVSLFFCA